MNHKHHDSQRVTQESHGEVRTEELLADWLAAESAGEDCDASHLPSFTASLYPRMPF